MLLDIGSGGTIKSTSYEAAFIEACQLLELSEESSTNPDAVNFTDVSHNNTAKTWQVTCQLPFTVAFASGGVPTFAPTAYVSPTFANGGGDITATTLPGAVLELAQTIQNTEKGNASLPNNTNIVYNTDDGVATITAAIPCVKSVSATGTIATTVTTYLP